MKKLLAFSIAFILLTQLVIAGEIFNEEIKDNIPFTIEGVRHIARYYPSAEKVSLKVGDDTVLIAVEDCENVGDLNYCIDSATEGIDDETGDASSTMDLRILQAGPDIDVERQVSEDEPALGEEVEVTVTLTNNGDEYAYNLNYEDSFPTGVKVTTSYKNPLKNGVLWTGNLASGKSTSFSYKLTFNDFVDYESIGQASFLFKNKIIKTPSEAVTFKVQTPFEITEEVSPRSADINGEITYTITINNTGSSQSITVNSMDISFPSGTTTSHRSLGLELEGNKLKYSGTLKSGTSETLSFRFKSNKMLEGELVNKLDIQVGSNKMEKESRHKVGFGISDIVPEIIFNPTEVKGGAELEIEAKITNYGEDMISDISLDMAGDVIEPRGWRNLELAPEKKHYAFNKIISAPQVEEEKDFFIQLKGSYETEGGNRMSFEKMETVTVIPQELLVEMTPTIENVGAGEYNVTLKVKNIAPFKLTYVSLIDTYPSGFKMTAGNRDKDLEALDVGEEVTVYSYIVKVADGYKGDSFGITHIMSALDKDEQKITNEKKTAVDIVSEEETSGEEGAEGTEGNETGTEDISEDAGEETEDKPGVFTRMWHWITGLFSGDDEPEDKFE